MRKVITFCFLLCFCATILMAGVSGKIEGYVRDAETGLPLAGVNVVLLKTYFGAATDQNGYYVMLNIPAGVYDVRASMIGYTDVTIRNVRISIDLSTKQDFTLSTEVLEAAETVTVTAQRPLLRRDEFTSRYTVNTEEIDLQPVDNFQAIARNQAGVVGSHFRGGRTGEVLVLVDGIPVRDPAGEYSGNMGGFTADIPEASIQEMEVTLGGFSAEYGNVQSGVLNLAMKEGGSNYAGRVRVQSTNFGSGLNDALMGERDRWYDTKYQHKLENIYQFSLSGPEPITDFLLGKPGFASFSFSGEVTDRKQSYFTNDNLFNQSYQGKLTLHISDNAKIAVGGLYSDKSWDTFYFPASLYGPGDDYLHNEYFRMASAGSSSLLHYVYVDDPSEYIPDNDPYQLNPAARDSAGMFAGDSFTTVQQFYVGPMQDYLWDRQQKARTGYLIWTHSLSSRSYYEVRLQSFYTNYHYATPDIEDRDRDGDTEEDLLWDNTLGDPNPIYRERGDNNYWWVRGDDPGYRDQVSRTQSLKTDFVSQVTSNHLLKGGLELGYHEMDVENISWTLGYGVNRKDIWKEDMLDVGMYIQDKMDFESIIALIGLRFDYFNPNGLGDPVYYPADYNYPFTSVDENGEAIFTEAKEATQKMQVSPRIAVSHPITDRDIIRFSYGHYFQRPDGYYLFRNLRFQALTKTGNWVGNPNLQPEKTVAYEIGLEHLFTDDIKVSINGYYKDVTDLMNNTKFVLRSAGNKETRVYLNADYGNIKGLELTLTKRVGRFWGGSVNYTFSVAKGRSSSSGSGSGAFTSERRMNVMDFDQTHTANANLTFRTPHDFIKGLNDWVANIQYKFGSGLPYSSYGTGKINDLRMPWTSNTDLRLSKQFQLYGVKLDLILDVFNLFNRRNVEWIGDSQYYQNGHAEDETVKGDPSVIRMESVGETAVFIRSPQVFNHRRQLRFGIAVQF